MGPNRFRLGNGVVSQRERDSALPWRRIDDRIISEPLEPQLALTEHACRIVSVKFRVQDLKHALHARLPERTQAPQIGPADVYSLMRNRRVRRAMNGMALESPSGWKPANPEPSCAYPKQVGAPRPSILSRATPPGAN
jgi:hypothetical protein